MTLPVALAGVFVVPTVALVGVLFLFGVIRGQR